MRREERPRTRTSARESRESGESGRKRDERERAPWQRHHRLGASSNSMVRLRCIRLARCSAPLQSTPLHSTPLHSTPLHSTPLHSTALHCTPSTPLYSRLDRSFCLPARPPAYLGESLPSIRARPVSCETETRQAVQHAHYHHRRRSHSYSRYTYSTHTNQAGEGKGVQRSSLVPNDARRALAASGEDQRRRNSRFRTCYVCIWTSPGWWRGACMRGCLWSAVGVQRRWVLSDGGWGFEKLSGCSCLSQA